MASDVEGKISLCDFGWLDTSEMLYDESLEGGWSQLIGDLLNEIDRLVAGTLAGLYVVQSKRNLAACTSIID